MKDQFNRTIEYMRISITDRCNLRCRYCMPNGVEQVGMSELLTFEEIGETAAMAASLGITKIKITGGEPLVRRGCAGLVDMLKSTPGIEQVTLTTNGTLLMDNLEDLLHAGIDGINVSLDTLIPDKFRLITGFDSLDNVLKGIEAAVKTGVQVKVNSVLQRGVNDNEWNDLVCLSKDLPLDVRFIEMMPIGEGASFESIGNDEILQKLKNEYSGVSDDSVIHGNGPAVYVKIPGFRGSIGFISAIHGKFCGSCNRIRLTSMGKLKPCLCYGDSVDIRYILREYDGQERKSRLREAISNAILLKPEQHCFEDNGMITEHAKMSAIGG